MQIQYEETTKNYIEQKNRQGLQPDEYPPPGIKEVGYLSGFGVTINCIIGTGFFAIPYGYYHAGLPLSILITILCGLMSGTGAVWAMEVQARARNYEMCEKNVNLLDASNNKISYKKIEYANWGYIFCGIEGRLFVSVVLLLYTQGSLWTYVSVFSSTTANLFSRYVLEIKEDCIIEEKSSTSSCHLVFVLSACLYALYVFIVIIFENNKLRYLQNFFTVYRFISFTLMVLSSIISLVCIGSQWPNDNEEGWHLLKIRNFPMLYASASVGLNGHFNLPNALSTLRTPKKYSHLLAFGSTMVAVALYVFCGTIICFALGPDVHEFVVLNWSRFGNRGFVPVALGGEVESSWWSVLLKLVIMLFPMMNMMSS